MKKYILKWTLGPVSDAGFEVLQESIKVAKRLFRDEFSYYVSCNNISSERLSILEKYNVNILVQNGENLPIVCEINSNLDKEVSNSVWKHCPPRIDINSYEIAIDNDLILTNRFHELEKFLESSDVLLLEDPLRFFGKYDRFIQPGLQFSAGLVGLPPGYDFGKALKQTWENYESLQTLKLDDEQGLTILTLLESPYKKIIISKERVPQLHPDGLWLSWASAGNGVYYRFTGKEDALHFVEINRQPNHSPWKNYQRSIYKTRL